MKDSCWNDKHRNQEYNDLKELSYLVLSITEEARKQSGIVFGCEG